MNYCSILLDKIYFKMHCVKMVCAAGAMFHGEIGCCISSLDQIKSILLSEYIKLCPHDKDQD